MWLGEHSGTKRNVGVVWLPEKEPCDPVDVGLRNANGLIVIAGSSASPTHVGVHRLAGIPSPSGGGCGRGRPWP